MKRLFPFFLVTACLSACGGDAPDADAAAAAGERASDALEARAAALERVADNAVGEAAAALDAEADRLDARAKAIEQQAAR